MKVFNDEANRLIHLVLLIVTSSSIIKLLSIRFNSEATRFTQSLRHRVLKPKT